MEDSKKLSSLSRVDNCSNNRAYSFQEEVNTNVGIAPAKAGICKDAIAYALKYNLRALASKQEKNSYEAKKLYGRWVMEYMNTRYYECGFMVSQQRKEQVLWDWRRVMRYLNKEVRVPEFPVATKEIKLADKKYLVKPDLVFPCGNQVEVVFIKTGEPYLNSRKTKELNINKLQLFAGVLYARSLGYTNIRSSFYFLKKSTDCSQWARCDMDFSGSNIVSMEDLYFGISNELDAEMEGLIKSLKTGVDAEEMCEKDCRFCRHYDVCKYTYPPVQEKEPGSEELAMEDHSIDPPTITYSDEQQSVIDSTSGVIRVIAAAGSGKTQTVAGRIAKLVESGTKPENILCITFSDAGAKEMLRKIERIIGAQAEEIKISTFHALEFEICKANFEQLGYKHPLTVIDDVQKFGIINELLKKYPILEWNGKAFRHYGVKASGSRVPGALTIVDDIFNQIKATEQSFKNLTSSDIGFDPEYISDDAVDKVISLYGKYEEMCLEKGLVSFDDMESLSRRVIESDKTYLDSAYSFEHIVVDEFQDTSEGQMDFVKHLKMLKSFKSLMVVGDDAQSIYGFRGTSPKYIIDFDRAINESCLDGTPVRQDSVKDIVLSKNYRSRQEILDFASDVLKKNINQIHKPITAFRTGEAQIEVNAYAFEDTEYMHIAESILEQHKNGVPYEDIAVLAFTKNELRKIADYLTRKGIPSMFGAPQPLMENSRIRAVLAFARVIGNFRNTKDASVTANAVYRAENASGQPFMHLSKQDIEKRVAAVVEKAKEIDKESNPVKKREIFVDFVRSFSLNDETVIKFLENLENRTFDEMIKYCSDFDAFGQNQQYRNLLDYPGVKLITAHSSKGLEWKVVYLTVNGFKNGRRDDVEESRRLLFVSMTRARDVLNVSGEYYDKVSLDGSAMKNKTMYELFELRHLDWAPELAYAREAKKSSQRKHSI